MPLKLQPVEPQDFDQMAKHVFHKGGDLAAPLVTLVWETTDDDSEMTARLQWSLNQQREIFDDDPTAHFVKVIDTDRDNDIISLARWHRYEHGYPYPDNLPFEYNGAKPGAESSWPAAINAPLVKAIIDPPLQERPSWQGRRPMWILMTLITKEPDRRRGAGGMLVDWGMQRAIDEGLPAFLEASIEGEPLYAKHGFRRVGEHKNDALRELGFDHTLRMARMAANDD